MSIANDHASAASARAAAMALSGGGTMGEIAGFAPASSSFDIPSAGPVQLSFWELATQRDSIVITAVSNEPSVDLRNSEVFSKTLFSRDDQVLQQLNAGISAGQHEGGGKSLEIRRFGFNLDHGGVNGGLKVLVDNVQQNQGTQGHGQGYLGALKSLSPELIDDVTIINGPFSAQYGDFSGLGVVHIRQRESLGDQYTVRLQGGNFDGAAGVVAGLGVISLLRYRKLVWVMLVVATLVTVLPQTQIYVERFIEGIQGQDLATQMRFGEYKDAFELISRYPLTGVGFFGTPDIDVYVGVSSVYLLLAQQMGLVGGGLYVVIGLAYLAIILVTLHRLPKGHLLEAPLLGYGLAILGAMVGGMFDHFYFNLTFIHIVALYWLTMGLGMVAVLLWRDQERKLLEDIK
jgi:hypothetical protein